MPETMVKTVEVLIVMDLDEVADFKKALVGGVALPPFYRPRCHSMYCCKPSETWYSQMTFCAQPVVMLRCLPDPDTCAPLASFRSTPATITMTRAWNALQDNTDSRLPSSTLSHLTSAQIAVLWMHISGCRLKTASIYRLLERRNEQASYVVFI